MPELKEIPQGGRTTKDPQTSAILLKDALEGLKELDSESADIIPADLPYNVGKDFGTTKDKLALPDYLKWCDELIAESVRILKPTGTLYLYGYPEIICHIAVRLPVPYRWLVWHYRNKNVASADFWQRSHEVILSCCKDTKARLFNADLIREPYTESALRSNGKPRRGSPGRFGDRETVYKTHPDGALPRDVICVPALAGGAGSREREFLCKTCQIVLCNCFLRDHNGHEIVQHPTQKPLELTRRLLLAAKPPKDGCVVVPFVGSGTEIVVAQNLGMKALGFDINPDYVQLARGRLEGSSNKYRNFRPKNEFPRKTHPGKSGCSYRRLGEPEKAKDDESEAKARRTAGGAYE